MYTLLLQLFIVLAVIICTVVWIAYTITKKNFQQIDYFVTVFSDAERGTYNNEKPAFIKDEYDPHPEQYRTAFYQPDIPEEQAGLKGAGTEAGGNDGPPVAESTPHFLFNTLQTLDFKALSIPGCLQP